ncbi:MAG: hypothetical protein H0W21_05550, partial [Actinobacteria bacterium]|nr:hypothetical protein [Actinomycetota bacterium]
MIDREVLTERLPGVGWVVALAGLLFIAVFSALWAPELWDRAGVLQSKGADRIASTAEVQTKNDSSSLARRDGASRASAAPGVILADDRVGNDAVLPVASRSSDREFGGESKASASTEPHGVMADSEREVNRTEPGASEHPVDQNGAPESGTSGHTDGDVPTTQPIAGNSQAKEQ